MDWGTLLATGVGAVFGAGTTVVVDSFRSRRDRDHHELAYRREVCGTFLGSISLATHRLYDIWDNASQTQQERSREAGRVLTESAGYLERQQLLMIAPGLEEQTNTLFGELRHLRFLVSASQRCGEGEWESAVTRVTVAMDGLRDAMLKDLSRTFRYATKTTLAGRKPNAKAVTTAETASEPAPEASAAGPGGARETPGSG